MTRNNRKQVKKKGNNHQTNRTIRNHNKRVLLLIREARKKGRMKVFDFFSTDPVVKDTKSLLGYMDINHSFSSWYKYIKKIDWVDSRVIVKTKLSDKEKDNVPHIANALIVWANDTSLQDKHIKHIIILDKDDKQINKVRV